MTRTPTHGLASGALGSVLRAPTPEENAARVAAQERWTLARTKARSLLESALNEEQRRELEGARYFTVHGGTTKRRYRVYVGSQIHGNIEEVDSRGQAIRRLCCAPASEGMPPDDAFLGQKLFLELDEEEFVRTSNVTELETGAVVRGVDFIARGGLRRAG